PRFGMPARDGQQSLPGQERTLGPAGGTGGVLDDAHILTRDLAGIEVALDVVDLVRLGARVQGNDRRFSGHRAPERAHPAAPVGQGDLLPAANRPKPGIELAVRGRSIVRDHRRHGAVLAGGALEDLDHSPASRAPLLTSSETALMSRSRGRSRSTKADTSL